MPEAAARTDWIEDARLPTMGVAAMVRMKSIGAAAPGIPTTTGDVASVERNGPVGTAARAPVELAARRQRTARAGKSSVPIRLLQSGGHRPFPGGDPMPFLLRQQPSQVSTEEIALALTVTPPRPGQPWPAARSAITAEELVAALPIAAKRFPDNEAFAADPGHPARWSPVVTSVSISDPQRKNEAKQAGLARAATAFRQLRDENGDFNRFELLALYARQREAVPPFARDTSRMVRYHDVELYELAVGGQQGEPAPADVASLEAMFLDSPDVVAVGDVASIARVDVPRVWDGGPHAWVIDSRTPRAPSVDGQAPGFIWSAHAMSVDLPRDTIEEGDHFEIGDYEFSFTTKDQSVSLGLHPLFTQGFEPASRNRVVDGHHRIESWDPDSAGLSEREMQTEHAGSGVAGYTSDLRFEKLNLASIPPDNLKIRLHFTLHEAKDMAMWLAHETGLRVVLIRKNHGSSSIMTSTLSYDLMDDGLAPPNARHLLDTCRTGSDDDPVHGRASMLPVGSQPVAKADIEIDPPTDSR